jgi:4-amino-4-deoxy-L-arabinose transferase-like glycosyltransferase
MLPLSIVFIALAVFVQGLRHVRWIRALVAVAIVAAISAPFVAAVSATKGRLTFGDTGKLAYVWFANGTKDRELHWSQEFPDDRRPVHPTRKIIDRPATYEFGFAPVAGSYPIWYDPSYWHEGETPHLDLRGQLRVFHWSAEELWQLFVEDSYVVFFAAFVLLAAGLAGWRAWVQRAGLYAELLVPAIAATAMYSIVLMSPRYIAAFVLIGWTGLFAAVRLPRSAHSRRLAWAVVAGITLMATLRVGPGIIAGANEIRSQRNDAGAHRAFAVAEGLRQLGARPGDRVARMGYGPPAYWAKLAGVRIVAEMFSEEPDFESVPDHEDAFDNGRLKPEIVAALRQAGARFFIALKLPPDIASQGWHELGHNTQWFAYPLEQ